MLTWKIIKLLAAMISLIVAAPVFHWLMQPLLERSRLYHFHSAFLFAFKNPKGHFELHFGTLYDFMTKLRKRRRGTEPWGVVLRRDVAQGIDRFAEWLEANGIDPATKVTMGSHFLNDRKMSRIGFVATPSPRTDFVNASMIYWELVVLQRIFTGRWRWVRIGRWKTYSCTVGELIANRSRIVAAFGGVS